MNYKQLMKAIELGSNRCFTVSCDECVFFGYCGTHSDENERIDKVIESIQVVSINV